MVDEPRIARLEARFKLPSNNVDACVSEMLLVAGDLDCHATTERHHPAAE